jgi:hypothetical protein
MPKSILTASAKFLVKSGTLAITDPRSATPTIVENVKNGHWDVFIDMREDDPSRVADICAYHSSSEPSDSDSDEFLPIPVDTGNLAICDAAFYRAQTDEECEAEPNDLLETADPFGSYYNGRGCVTESGYGDGLYPAMVTRHKGKVTAVYVNFDKFTSDEDEDTQVTLAAQSN